MMRFFHVFLLAALLPAAWMAGAEASEFLVLPDGSGDYPSIQPAIDASDPGGIVWLGDGEFVGFGNSGLDFNGKNLILRSQSDQPENCVIQCFGGSSGIRLHSGEDLSSLVRGITFANGSSEGGGGAYLYQSGATFRNCVFIGGNAIDGGGLCLWSALAEVDGCVFRYNHALNQGAALFASCGSEAWIHDCRFEFNESDDRGGAIHLVGCNSMTGIENCVFYDNTAVTGGALYLEYAPVTIISCTFAENHADICGGIWVDGDGPTLSRSILAFNDSQAISCYRVEAYSDPALSCCDIYGNEHGDWVNCIADQLGVDDNFSADPLFCGDPHTGTLTLKDISPCAPEGSACGALVGAEPVACDETAVAASDWSALKLLY